MSETASPEIDPYNVFIGNQKADPYRIARAYGINDPVIFQALKKLLRCGRKHKERDIDIREVITSLERWEAMNAEDAANKDQIPLSLDFSGEPALRSIADAREKVAELSEAAGPPRAKLLQCPDCGKPSLPGSDYCGVCIHEPGPR